MSSSLSPAAVSLEHLTPHDLVTYSRCPFEMELQHQLRSAHNSGQPVPQVFLAAGAAERHSPLFAPPHGSVRVFEGRLDLLESDVLVYEDEGEDDLPMLFPPERVRRDPAFHQHGGNLNDDVLGLSGRPDFVIRRANGGFVPIEYKATHLFAGWRAMHVENHARGFDLIQTIAECRLVHAVSGVRPPYGMLLYGDGGQEGAHEGWVEVPYGEAEERWLRAALVQIRSDRQRAPVPSEGHCAPCEPNRGGYCRYAAVPFGPPPRNG